MSTFGRIGKFSCLVVASTVFATVVATPVSAGRLDTDVVSVIVQEERDAGAKARSAVAALGGEVSIDLPIVAGFAAVVPETAVSSLERADGVRFVTIDRPVRLMGDFD